MKLVSSTFAGLLALPGCASFETAPSSDAARSMDGRADAGVLHDATTPRDAVRDVGVTKQSDAARDGGGGGHVDAARDAPPDVGPARDTGHDAGHADAPPDASAVCSAATCQVVTMAKGLHVPIAVAVDDQYLYWLEWGGIGANDYGELVQILKNMPCLSPSCYGVLDPLVLANDVTTQTAMGLGPSAVCYTQSFDEPAQHSVTCIPFSGGNSLSLEQGAGYAEGIWVGDSGAVWALAGSTATSKDGAIHASTFAGVTSTLASGRAQPWAVTSDGQTAYWTEVGETTDAGAVYRSAPDGGVDPLATGQDNPLAVALFDGVLYWTDAAGGSVWSVGVAPPSPTQLVASSLVAPFAVAVDASGVYVASAGSSPSYLDGSVVHIALSGGVQTVMLSDENELEGIAIDGTYVYAVVAGTGAKSGEILRIPKVAD